MPDKGLGLSGFIHGAWLPLYVVTEIFYKWILGGKNQSLFSLRLKGDVHISFKRMNLKENDAFWTVWNKSTIGSLNS